MISTIYWINEPQLGQQKIGTMARPRGNDWLEAEIKALKNQSVACLVSLLERAETWELGLQHEAEVCATWGIDFINFPIPDIHVPTNEAAFLQLTQALAERIQGGQSLVIHCRMGIGRSSLLAGAILIRLGYAATEVFGMISQYRGLAVPDTEAQRAWLLGMGDRLGEEGRLFMGKRWK